MSPIRRILHVVGWTALAYFAVPVVAPAGLVPGLDAVAAEETAPERKTRRVPTISERTYKKLSEAQVAFDAKDVKTAISILDGMADDRGLNGNELGQIHNMYAYGYFSLEDYDKAIFHYEKVVAQGEAIPEGLEVGTIYSLAQLYFVTEKFQKALDYMRLWISKANNPGADPHIFMGQVYYQMKDFPNAIKQIEKGMAIARERGQAIKENWWQLLRYLYFENENWPKVIEILEILVRDFPKREYWLQLAGVYGQEGQESKQVLAMEAAHAGGFLTNESDCTTYSGLLMQADVPYRAAKWLEKCMKDGVVERSAKNLQMLGSAQQVAQDVDKAIPVLEEAAKKSDDGDIYARLAQLRLEKDQYKECVTDADQALRKGGLRKPANTHIVKGMCLFNADRLNDARAAFSRASELSRGADDASNQRMAQQWIAYIDSEKLRREQLAKAM